MNKIEEIVFSSHLQKFFHTEKNLIVSYKRIPYWDIIQLNLTITDISYIERDYVGFAKACENFLNLWNYASGKHFKNITFNTIQTKEHTVPYCLLCFNSQKFKKYGFLKSRKFLKFQEQKVDQLEKNDFERILDLIYAEEISVRKIMKLWIRQKAAREIYAYIKNLGIFSLHLEDNNKKKYYFENLHFIEKEDIEEIIHWGV